MFLNIVILSLCLNYRPLTYQSVKSIKKHYYDNLLTYDIYNNNTITNNKLLTAEHVFPQSFCKMYTYAKRDMHNIFLTTAESNLYRSNYPFIENINELNILQSFNYFIPCEFARGQIARTLAYMKFIYPKISIEKSISLETLFKWNKEFEPNELEIKRNNLIYKIQGNFNPFILEPNGIEEIFKN